MTESSPSVRKIRLSKAEVYLRFETRKVKPHI
jgi:hypothetical protein